MFKLEEQSDVFVDACVADHQHQLLFVSVYGRDTSIQQFMARLHCGRDQGGIERLQLVEASPTEGRKARLLDVLVGDAKRLTKLTGRMPRTGLLGNLVHAWIFQDALLEVDHTAHAAWLFKRGADSQQLDADDFAQIWRLVEELSPVPLLPHWSLQVLAYLRSRECLKQPRAVGPVMAIRVEIPDDFSDWVSARVKAGDFTEQPSQALLQGLPVPRGATSPSQASA
jgi:hypothetical protein